MKGGKGGDRGGRGGGVGGGGLPNLHQNNVGDSPTLRLGEKGIMQHDGRESAVTITKATEAEEAPKIARPGPQQIDSLSGKPLSAEKHVRHGVEGDRCAWREVGARDFPPGPCHRARGGAMCDVISNR